MGRPARLQQSKVSQMNTEPVTLVWLIAVFVVGLLSLVTFIIVLILWVRDLFFESRIRQEIRRLRTISSQGIFHKRRKE